MRVLVFGMSSLLGGVESFIMSYSHEMKGQDASFQFDYLCIDEAPPFLSNMKEAAPQHLHIVPNRLSNPIGYRKAISQVFERNEFDCFWFNVCTLSDITPAIEANRHSVPVIVHAHNSQNMGNWVNGILHGLHKRTIAKYADCYLSCSDEASEFMFPPCAISSDLHHIIPNAIEIDKFRFSEKYRNEVRRQYGIEEKIVFGNVGRFHPQKNHLYLIEIFKLIHDELGDSELILVGDGVGRAKVQNRVKELGLSDSVVFAGESHNVERLYSAMDCFLFPSLYEGFGLVALEAQASGLPCIMTENSPSMVSVLDSCRRLSVSDAPRKWARAAIDSVQAPPVDREQCANTILDSDFNISNSAGRVIELFRNCTRKRGR